MLSKKAAQSAIDYMTKSFYTEQYGEKFIADAKDDYGPNDPRVKRLEGIVGDKNTALAFNASVFGEVRPYYVASRGSEMEIKNAIGAIKEIAFDMSDFCYVGKGKNFLNVSIPKYMFSTITKKRGKSAALVLNQLISFTWRLLGNGIKQPPNFSKVVMMFLKSIADVPQQVTLSKADVIKIIKAVKDKYPGLIAVYSEYKAYSSNFNEVHKDLATVYKIAFDDVSTKVSKLLSDPKEAAGAFGILASTIGKVDYKRTNEGKKFEEDLMKLEGYEDGETKLKPLPEDPSRNYKIELKKFTAGAKQGKALRTLFAPQLGGAGAEGAAKIMNEQISAYKKQANVRSDAPLLMENMQP